ncbi:MAG: hypothetical protein QOE11_2438 [Solirubrobacteraceae bacterium]|jgi:hypothetical protein|nr:hypothetical protein [Solirubrobacteraceae bacterium]
MALVLRALVAAVLVLGLGACGHGARSPANPAAFTSPPPGGSWAPAAVDHGGLRTVAEPRAGKLALHTVSGDVTFWTGVNLGSTTPGHSPGELAIGRADYRRWFAQMGRLGVRVLRIYTIHPPRMYEELLAYNRAHPAAPLYLMQGVYLPDESYLRSGNLYARRPTRAFTQELRAASRAVHGTLRRPAARGRAGGRWSADVSRWVAGWVIGVEWDGRATKASDTLNAAAPDFHGRFFSSVSDATSTTPTERWIAARMDELATAEAAKGDSAPIAFVNWPTADPLHHPHEPLAQEDLVGVDANHVRASAAWPGGTFASFHAYPYYPDFLRHEPAYQAYRLHGRSDPYAGYLADLAAHFRHIPLMITEVGVPSSLGSAHVGTDGRDQGAHSEQEALATDAALVRVAHDAGASGALIFSWADEWFKFTWNTLPRHAVVNSERGAVWHDPLTNEQWFGLHAEDPVAVGTQVLAEARTGVRQLAVDHDASYLDVDVRLEKAPVAPIRLGFDVVPGGLALPGGGGAGEDVAVVVDPRAHRATASIRRDLDPLLLDGQKAADLPAAAPGGWTLQRMSTNRSYRLDGRFLPAEYQPVGDLREGVWDVRSARQDSRATWHVEGTVLSLRLPWSMLALADPSSHTAVRPVDGLPKAVGVQQIGLRVDAGPGGSAAGTVRWEGWQKAPFRERLKTGVQPLVDAWAALSRPGA